MRDRKAKGKRQISKGKSRLYYGTQRSRPKITQLCSTNYQDRRGFAENNRRQKNCDQLLRSGTSVGANYEEAQGAESSGDFVHKLQIALKELRESNYWLRVIAGAALLPKEKLTDILDESDQLCRILSKAVATAKGKAKTNELKQ